MMMKRVLGFLLSLACILPGHSPAAEPAGWLDPTFGVAGFQTYGLGQALVEPGTALAKSPDGRLYMLGRTQVGPPVKQGIAFMRMWPDGAKDLTFGGGGRRTYSDSLLGNLVVHDAAFQPNGKLVVAGEATTLGTQPEKGMLVCRFNPDGTPDEAFGGIEASPGCTFAKVSEGAVAHALVIQADGRIALAGWTYVSGKQRALIARVKSDGSLDTSIAGSGFRMPFPSTDSSFRDIAVGPAGGSGARLVAVGERTLAGEPDYDFLVAQFTLSDGTLDANFNPGSQAGRRTIPFNTGGVFAPHEVVTRGHDRANAVKVASSGKVYVAGQAQVMGLTGNVVSVVAVVALNPDGSDDLQFKGDGQTYYTACRDIGEFFNYPSKCDQAAHDITLINGGDGGMVFAGSSGSSMFALRVGSTGSELPFGAAIAAGFALVDAPLGFDAVAYRTVMQGERVLVAGAAKHALTDLNYSDFVIARLDHGIQSGYVVTPSVFPPGTGTTDPAAPQPVAHSAFVHFTLTPAANHALQNVTGTCPGSLIGDVFVAGPITGNCSVNATFAADVNLTYVAGENGMLHWEQGYVQSGGQIVKTVPYGGTGPAVEAIPHEGFKFLKWSDNSVANPRVDTNVTGSLNVTAKFLPKTYLVSQQLPAPAGGTMMPTSRVVQHGNTAPFTILPDPGYGVASVTSPGCEGVLAGNAYVTGAVTADCQVDIDFVPSETVYTLTYRSSPQCEIEGAIDGVVQQTVASGHDGTLVKAVPKPGYQFVAWSDGAISDAIVDGTAERSDKHVFNHVDATAQCAAVDAVLYSVDPVYDNGGLLVPFKSMLVAAGAAAQFEVLPKEGYALDTIGGCGSGVLQGSTYTTAPVTADCEVVATFIPSEIHHALRYAAGPGGLLAGATTQDVLAGGSGTAVEAVAAAGHYFLKWSDGSTDNPRQDTHVMADVDVVAEFATEGMIAVASSAGPGGQIAPETVQAVAPGTVLQFEVSPEPMFGIAGVSGCGGVLQGKLYTTAPIQADCHVQAHFAGSDASYWLVYAAGPHGTVEGELAQQLKSGESGSAVLAKPDEGYAFLQWSDGVASNPRTDAHVIADVNATALFASLDALVVTPTHGIGGTIEPGVPQVVESGAVLQFEVLPDDGFTIDEVGGDCGGSLQGKLYTTLPIVASCSVHASFVPSQATYLLTYVAGANGTVNLQGEPLQQQIVQQVLSGADGLAVEAKGAEGFFFVAWSDGSTQNPRVDAHVIADLEVTAEFAAIGSLVVTPIVDGVGGSITPGNPQVVAAGAVLQFEVHPDDGFLIDAVDSDCGAGGGLIGNTYTTAAITANCEVRARFVASNQSFQLTYLSGPGGIVLGPVQQIVPAGGEGQAVTAQASNGYFFVKWSDGWTESERTDSDVSADLIVTAEFAQDGTSVHVVTPTVFGTGGGWWPDTPQNVVDGDNVVFTVKPNPGFAVAEVTGCDGVLVGNQYVTAPVLADCEVQATFVASAAEFVLTYRAGANGSLLSAGQSLPVVTQGALAGGSGPLVEAVPADGFVFVQWTDGSTVNPRQDTNVVGAIDVTAEFAEEGTPIHLVVPLAGAGGALNPPVPQHVAQGDTAQFEVLPQEGHAVLSVGGTCGGAPVGNLYVTQPVAADCTVEANFAPSDQVFSLVYNAGAHGLVNGTNVVAQNVVAGGSGPLVTATADPGYVFLKWSDGALGNPRQENNVSGNLEVTAEFAPVGSQTHVVTPIASAGGGMSPALPIDVVEGESAQFTLLPLPGYGIQSVGGSCGGSLVGNLYTTDPVSGDCTVEASFFDDRIFANGFDPAP